MGGAGVSALMGWEFAEKTRGATTTNDENVIASAVSAAEEIGGAPVSEPCC
jgi:hypothetical protein